MTLKPLPIVLLTMVLGLAACQESDDAEGTETETESMEETEESSD